MTNPVLDFTLTPAMVTRVGRDLVRPECVLADAADLHEGEDGQRLERARALDRRLP